MSGVRRSRGEAMRCVVGRSLLVGAVVMVFFVALRSSEYAATRGRPVERATVTSQIMTTDLIRCGKDVVASTYVQRTTFEVSDPASGLPATFTHAGCPLDQGVGDSVVIVRLGPMPWDRVYFEPITTLAGLGRFAAGWACAAVVVSAAYFGSACRGQQHGP